MRCIVSNRISTEGYDTVRSFKRKLIRFTTESELQPAQETERNVWTKTIKCYILTRRNSLDIKITWETFSDI